MALPTSGPLSINDIHIEAGGSSGTTASLNDADIRGLIGKASGAQNAISEYYGASAASTIRFEATGGNGGDAIQGSPYVLINAGGVGGKTVYTVDATPGTQFNVWVGDRGNDGNLYWGGGGGAGSVVRSTSGTYLLIVGGGGGAGYFGGDGGSGGAVNASGLTGSPAYSNGGGNGGGSGVGGDESVNNVRYAGFDGEDWNGSTLFGTGGQGGGPAATGGLAGTNGNNVTNGGRGGDGQISSDSGGGGGGGGYGGGAGGAILASSGAGAGGGGGGAFARTSGMPAGVTYVSATGTTGGNTVSGGQAEVKVYVDNVLNTTYTAGTSNVFTVP